MQRGSKRKQKASKTSSQRPTKKKKQEPEKDKGKEKVRDEDKDGSTDTEESAPTQKRRGKAWEWHANYSFLKIMNKVGVNWGKVLNEMHAKHLATECTTTAQKRERWKILSKPKSCVWKEDWPGKKWNPRLVPKGAGKNEVRLLEERHAEQVSKRDRQMLQAQKWINDIKAREVVLTSETAQNASELKAAVKSANDQRRAMRDHRLQLAEEAAARESKCQEAMISLAPKVEALLDHTRQMEEMLARHLALRDRLLEKQLADLGV